MDLYAGTASLGVAAQSLGLTYYGVEMSEDVCEAARLRLGAFADYQVQDKILEQLRAITFA